MKHGMTAVAALVWAAAVQAGVTVTNVVIQQRWPWNGLVDIDYEVVSDDPDVEASIYPTGYDRQNCRYILMSTLSGDGAGTKVKAGTHHMIWNMTQDAPTLFSTNFSVKLQAVSGMAPYLVVDLSPGPDALCYPIQYLAAIPAGGWTDEFKTTKLVLRLIMPDTFIMGSPLDELGRQTDELQHQVTLTQPYYIGVFEVTQKQWMLVMNSNPSGCKGDLRPVECVSYNLIRGNNLGNKWPSTNSVDATSFMSKLRVKSGFTFDLPTEAQWECACRAGTSTALNNGKNLTNENSDASMAMVGRCSSNQNDSKGGYSQHTTVGSYLPNSWGLHDMHGNVAEWCLDWQGSYLGEVVDPKGAVSGNIRALRGGYWNGRAADSRSAYRDSNYIYGTSYGPSASRTIYGFRVLAFTTMQ